MGGLFLQNGAHHVTTPYCPNWAYPVFTGEFSGHTMQLVDARSLHGFLAIGKHFASWITTRIKEYGFIENQDFALASQNREIKKGKGGDRRSKNYHLTLDTAKELAMVERTNKGRDARRYFIECERIVLQQEKALPSPAISPAQQSDLQQAVAARSGTDGKIRAYYWSRFNRHFKLGSYKQLAADCFDDALLYIQTMLGKPLPAPQAPNPLTGQHRFMLVMEDGVIKNMNPVPDDCMVFPMNNLPKLMQDQDTDIKTVFDVMQSCTQRISRFHSDMSKTHALKAAITGR